MVNKRWLAGILGIIFALFPCFCLRYIESKPMPGMTETHPLGESLIFKSYDFWFSWKANDTNTVNDVVIIYMDEFAHEELEQFHAAPWDRNLHAQLLRRLKKDGAKMVVMDIFFDGPSYPDPSHPDGPDAAVQAAMETDKNLAAAMKEFGNVVIVAEYLIDETSPFYKGSSFSWPFADFEDAAAGVGLSQLNRADDHGVREYLSGVIPLGDSKFAPSLTWKAAELLEAPAVQESSSEDKHRWIYYYGPAGLIPWKSYHLALSPDGTPEGFKDKIVFIGSASSAGYTGAFRDTFRTPYTSPTDPRYSSGVEVHATSLLNLLHQDWLTRIPLFVETLILLFCGIIFGYGLVMLRPIPAALLAITGSLAVAGSSYALFVFGKLWFPWLLIVAIQAPIALLWSIIYHNVLLYGQKKALDQSLSLHLSPMRVKQIQKHKELLKPGAEKQEITILFSDIANFSQISGRMDTEDLFKMLNQYFQTTLTCIHNTDGTVIKLIGDAIFAIWNAPFVQPDQQLQASKAALQLHAQLLEFDEQQHSLPLTTRVGLHTGTAMVGNVGSDTRFDYTAIGDSINLASRLEGLNKHLGTDILASRETQKLISEEILTRLVGHFKLKGIDRVVEVHELIGFPKDTEITRKWREAFAKGLFKFQRQDFDGAKEEFNKTARIKLDDGPSLFYLEQIKTYQENPPSKDWTGEVIIAEK